MVRCLVYNYNQIVMAETPSAQPAMHSYTLKQTIFLMDLLKVKQRYYNMNNIQETLRKSQQENIPNYIFHMEY
jgi:hypothetical protein